MEFQNKAQKMVDIRQKITYFVKIRGPVLPVHVAKELGISMLFASAFLSELVSDKTLKISNMKVGGSPVYFLPGQEPEVERFYNSLPGKEKEAFLLLKEQKILKDTEQEPAIRVALRSIKDFAIPFKSNEEVFWRFLTFKEEDVIRMMEPPQIKPEIPVIRPEIRPQVVEQETKRVGEKLIKELKPQLETKPQITTKPEEKPLVKLKQVKIKKEKIQPVEFLNQIKEFLTGKDIELVEEISYDKKEVYAKIRINSDLGKISFLLIAKDKRRVTESDLIAAYQKAINEKMPCYFLARGELSDNTKKQLETYKNLIKFENIK